MKPSIGEGAEPSDITGVLGNIGLEENDMKHDKTWKLEQLDCRPSMVQVRSSGNRIASYDVQRLRDILDLNN